MTRTDVSTHIRRRWVRICVLVGIWSLLAILFASQHVVAFRRSGKSIEWYQALAIELSYCYLWALLTPLILLMARRFRLDAGRWAANLTIHLIASAVVSLITRGYHDYAVWSVLSSGERPFSFVGLLQSVFFLVDYGIMIYWLILLVYYSADYYRRYRLGELKASTLQSQLAEAQLKALKMQLHPHFLFNTLNSVIALLNRDPEAAEKMLTRLGDFLRLTLDNSGAQQVSLRREMEFLSCYLEIEKIRFQDRLRVETSIESGALEARVPNLILQPIVENAIRHAIAPSSSPGLIRIAARRRDGMLRLQVTDTGPGLPSNGANGSVVKGGVGVANTHARLWQLYGRRYLLDLANADGGGLVVTIEFPYRKSETRPMEGNHESGEVYSSSDRR